MKWAFCDALKLALAQRKVVIWPYYDLAIMLNIHQRHMLRIRVYMCRLWALFDGHEGEQAAEFAASSLLPDLLAAELNAIKGYYFCPEDFLTVDKCCLHHSMRYHICACSDRQSDRS